MAAGPLSRELCLVQTLGRISDLSDSDRSEIVLTCKTDDSPHEQLVYAFILSLRAGRRVVYAFILSLRAGRRVYTYAFCLPLRAAL